MLYEITHLQIVTVNVTPWSMNNCTNSSFQFTNTAHTSDNYSLLLWGCPDWSIVSLQWKTCWAIFVYSFTLIFLFLMGMNLTLSAKFYKRLARQRLQCCLVLFVTLACCLLLLFQILDPYGYYKRLPAFVVRITWKLPKVWIYGSFCLIYVVMMRMTRLAMCINHCIGHKTVTVLLTAYTIEIIFTEILIDLDFVPLKCTVFSEGVYVLLVAYTSVCFALSAPKISRYTNEAQRAKKEMTLHTLTKLNNAHTMIRIDQKIPRLNYPRIRTNHSGNRISLMSDAESSGSDEKHRSRSIAMRKHNRSAKSKKQQVKLNAESNKVLDKFTAMKSNIRNVFVDSLDDYSSEHGINTPAIYTELSDSIGNVSGVHDSQFVHPKISISSNTLSPLTNYCQRMSTDDSKLQAPKINLNLMDNGVKATPEYSNFNQNNEIRHARECMCTINNTYTGDNVDSSLESIENKSDLDLKVTSSEQAENNTRNCKFCISNEPNSPSVVIAKRRNSTINTKDTTGGLLANKDCLTTMTCSLYRKKKSHELFESASASSDDHISCIQPAYVTPSMLTLCHNVVIHDTFSKSDDVADGLYVQSVGDMRKGNTHDESIWGNYLTITSGHCKANSVNMKPVLNDKGDIFLSQGTNKFREDENAKCQVMGHTTVEQRHECKCLKHPCEKFNSSIGLRQQNDQQLKNRNDDCNISALFIKPTNKNSTHFLRCDNDTHALFLKSCGLIFPYFPTVSDYSASSKTIFTMEQPNTGMMDDVINLGGRTNLLQNNHRPIRANNAQISECAMCSYKSKRGDSVIKEKFSNQRCFDTIEQSYKLGRSRANKSCKSDPCLYCKRCSIGIGISTVKFDPLMHCFNHETTFSIFCKRPRKSCWGSVCIPWMNDRCPRSSSFTNQQPRDGGKRIFNVNTEKGLPNALLSNEENECINDKTALKNGFRSRRHNCDRKTTENNRCFEITSPMLLTPLRLPSHVKTIDSGYVADTERCSMHSEDIDWKGRLGKSLDSVRRPSVASYIEMAIPNSSSFLSFQRLRQGRVLHQLSIYAFYITFLAVLSCLGNIHTIVTVITVTNSTPGVWLVLQVFQRSVESGILLLTTCAVHTVISSKTSKSGRRRARKVTDSSIQSKGHVNMKEIIDRKYS